MSILDRFKLEGQVAVVTGAGRGIGAASAIALAQAGADVCISSRTESQLEEVRKEIEAAGRRCLVVPANLNKMDVIADLAQQTVDGLGRLDIVVNNVGGSIPNTFMDTDVKYLEDAFHWNVSTAHALTRAAVPLLLATEPVEGAGQKTIVNIASVIGRIAGRGYLAYGVGKGALAHYTRLAALDLAPRIRVNAVMVGSIMTSALEYVAANPDVKQTMEEATPLGTLGEPEDIAACVLYLASKASQYMTGKLVEVDGGIQQANLDLGLPDL